MKTFAHRVMTNSNIDLENSLTEAQREELRNTLEAKYADIHIGDLRASNLFNNNVNFRMMFMAVEEENRTEFYYTELRKSLLRIQ